MRVTSRDNGSATTQCRVGVREDAASSRHPTSAAVICTHHAASAALENGESSTLAECPVEPTCPESAVSRVRTRMIDCRVLYAAGQGYCSPVRPMHTPHSPTAPDGDATRLRPAGDTHSTRQLWVGRALTAPPPPQQLWLPLEYSREGLRPRSGVPERAMPSRVSRAQTQHTHQSVLSPH